MPHSLSLVLTVAAAVAAALIVVRFLAHRWLAHRSAKPEARAPLWEFLYGLDWGEATANNYGFHPSKLEGPERFQLQMYQELLRRAVEAGLRPRTRLLEVSCGRGGGLAHLCRVWPGELGAIGLDLSENALVACRRRWGETDSLSFRRGSALELPFANGSFDVVVNVEASNDYGDHGRFFREVARVLRPGGLFLYCDSRRAEDATRVAAAFRAAGFEGGLQDITPNVLAACREDADRRLALIRRGAPLWVRLLFGRRLRSYAAVPDSRKFKAFRSRRRLYVMACARRSRRPAEAVAEAQVQLEPA